MFEDEITDICINCSQRIVQKIDIAISIHCARQTDTSLLTTT